MADIEHYNNIDFRNVVTGKNVPTPVNAGDIAPKSYVDSSILALILAIDKKDAVVALATSNINNSSAPNTLDGVTLQVGDRIGEVGQTTGSQNGIWVVQTLGTGSNGVWVRASDADTSAKVTQGLSFDVASGTKAGTTWLLNTPNPIVLNTTTLTFIQTNTGTVRKYTATLTAGASSYLVTHNLGTEFIKHSLKNTSTNKFVEGVICSTAGSTTTATIDFGEVTSVNFELNIQG
jgi:hypothetical protein